MTRQIELVILNVDIDDDDTDELISAELSKFGWFRRDGITTATVYLPEGADAVASACDAAHQIENVTGGKVARVFEDAVGVSDIAERTGFHRETSRLLTLGKRGPGGFPAHRGTVGSGSKAIRLWHWADVVPWLQQQYSLCVDEQPLSVHEITQINAHLERVTHDFDKAWHRSNHAPRVQTEVTVAAIEFDSNVLTHARWVTLVRTEEHVRPDEAGFVALSR